MVTKEKLGYGLIPRLIKKCFGKKPAKQDVQQERKRLDCVHTTRPEALKDANLTSIYYKGDSSGVDIDTLSLYQEAADCACREKYGADYEATYADRLDERIGIDQFEVGDMWNCTEKAPEECGCE